jgi:BirA family biotin operon repressor/biotin-[acetyl-CoA-carboxylase] ligase
MNNKLPSWLRYYNLIIFDEIDSTNDEAKRLATSGVDGEFIVWAKSQDKGKGRYGKKWISPEGNLYISLLLRPDYDLVISSQLSFVVAVAIGEALNSSINSTSYNMSEINITYKWPNDILFNGKKLCGILLESSIKSNSSVLDWLIVGVGLNISSFPNDLPYEATSLHNESLSDIKLNNFVDIFMKSFCYYYDIWLNDGFDIIRKKWTARAMGLEEAMTVSSGKDRISGIFEGITNDGSLKLTLCGGQSCYVSAGEIFYNK